MWCKSDVNKMKYNFENKFMMREYFILILITFYKYVFCDVNPLEKIYL